MLPIIAWAETRQPTTSITTPQKVVDLIDKFGGWFYSILFALAIVYIIYAAFKFLTAGGDEKKIEEARQQLIYAIVALAVAMLATGVVTVLKEFLGVG